MFVRHAEIRVTQVVADRQLLLAQFRQHRSCRMAERVPAHPGDSDSFERGPDLSLQDRSQIESFSTTVEPRRVHEIRRLRAVLCVLHSSSASFRAGSIGRGLAEPSVFVLFQMPPRRP